MSKLITVFIIIGIILVGGGYAGYFYFVQKDSQKILTDTDRSALKSGQGKSYEDLSAEELEARAKDKTGYAIKDLKRESIDESSFSSFEQAKAAAQVLSVANEPTKSLATYRAAERIASDDQRTAEFYRRYQFAADTAGNYDEGTEAVKKQLAWYRRQTDDPAAPQQIAILEQRLDVRAQEKGRREN